MAGLLSDIARRFRGETRTGPGVASALPRYVERDDDWCRCQPGELNGVTARLFPLNADKSTLTDLCNKLFNNVPSNNKVHVTPLCPLAVIGMIEYDCASSKQEPDSDWGYLAYKEAAVFIPVTLTVSREIRPAIAAVPYLFVDRFPPIVTGIETFGFPKRLAKLEFTSNSWCVRADVVQEAKQQIDEAVVLNIYSPDAPKEDPIRFRPEEDVSSRLQRIAEIVVNQLEPSERVTVGPFNEAAVVLLKQFRDATHPTTACHQSIVLAHLKVTKLPEAVTLEGEFKCEIPEYKISTKIVRTLGLRLDSIGIGVRMMLNFDLTRGETLWP